MRSGSLFYFFLVLVGIVVGSLVANIAASVPALGWLAYSLSFGLETPFVLDLSIIRLTFGLSVDLSVSVILFIAISLAVGRYLFR